MDMLYIKKDRLNCFAQELGWGLSINHVENFFGYFLPSPEGGRRGF